MSARRPWTFAGLPLRQAGAYLLAAVRKEGSFDLAAQLAFWSLLALFPFSIVALTLCGFIPLRGLDDRLLETIHQLMPAQAATLFETTVRQVVGRQHGVLLGLSLAGALWTASSGVSSTMTALNKAWGVTDSRSFWRVKLISLGVTVAGVILLVIAIVALMIGPNLARQLWEFLGFGTVFDVGWRLMRWPLIALSLMLLLSLVYWRLPDLHRRYRFLSPGVVAASALWICVSLGFRLYVSSYIGNYANVYGTLGGAVALMMWLYLSGLVVILGGQVDALSDRMRNRPAIARPA